MGFGYSALCILAAGMMFVAGSGRLHGGETLATLGLEPSAAPVKGALIQEAYLKPAVIGVADRFGATLALDGDWLIVGAPSEDGGGAGPTADPQDDSADDAGAAYIFVRSGQRWVQDAYLKASNPSGSGGCGILCFTSDFGDRFGSALAISGHIVAVGAPFEDSDGAGVNPDNQDDGELRNRGAVYVFVREGSRWVQEAYLKPEAGSRGNLFGSSVALHGDRLAVGAYGENAVYLFERDAALGWRFEVRLTGSNTEAGDAFGREVALEADTLAVGAPFEASAGRGVNPGPRAERDNSTRMAGAVYIFVRQDGAWTQQAYLKASNTDPEAFSGGAQFGEALSLFGNSLAVGAPQESSMGAGVNPSPAYGRAHGSGAVYVFERQAETWREHSIIKASNAGAGFWFGGSVALDGETLAIGSAGERSMGSGINRLLKPTASDAIQHVGATYVFIRHGDAWRQQAFIKASHPAPSQFYGTSVALHGGTLAIGASGEANDTPGPVPGTPDRINANAPNAGAVYILRGFGADAVPRFHAARRNHLEFSGEIGRRYRLQQAPTPAARTWTDVLSFMYSGPTNLAGATGPGMEGTRFYRVVAIDE